MITVLVALAPYILIFMAGALTGAVVALCCACIGRAGSREDERRGIAP